MKQIYKPWKIERNRIWNTSNIIFEFGFLSIKVYGDMSNKEIELVVEDDRMTLNIPHGNLVNMVNKINKDRSISEKIKKEIELEGICDEA